MSIEFDKLRNSDTYVLLDSVNGYIKGVYSWNCVRQFFEECGLQYDLDKYFTEEELFEMDEVLYD